MKMNRAIIPSFFTIINMFFGFYSVIAASRGNFSLAVWLIFVAAVMDALDGKIARLTNASSEFGVEYDSLADVVSFGFAPSYLIYVTYFKEWGNLGMFVSFAPLLFGSLRLARFNVQLEGFEKTHFTGLPIPAAAVTISSFLLFENDVLGGVKHFKIFLFIVIATSLLMISNIRYELFPRMKLDGTKKQFFRVMFVYLGVLSLFWQPSRFLFILAVIYVFSGLAGAFRRNIGRMESGISPLNRKNRTKKGRRKNESNREGETETRDS